MNILTKNEHLQLTFTQTQDIPFVQATEGDAENATYICQWTAAQHGAVLGDVDTYHLIARTPTGTPVGFVILKGLTNPHDSIELMRIVITEKGAGYGKNSLSLIKKWCFEEKGAHRLWLDVQENNHRAQHVYKSQGFTLEGILRECLKVGDTYKSLMIMSTLAKEYQADL